MAAVEWDGYDRFGDGVEIGALLVRCRGDDRTAIVSFEQLRNAAEYQGCAAPVAEPLVPQLVELAKGASRQAVRLEARALVVDLSRVTSYAEASGGEFPDESKLMYDSVANVVRSAATAALSLLPEPEIESDSTVLDRCWLEAVKLGAESNVAFDPLPATLPDQVHVVQAFEGGWKVGFRSNGSSFAEVLESTAALACARLLRRVRADPNVGRRAELDPVNAALFGLWAGWMFFEEVNADLEAVARCTGPMFDPSLEGDLYDWIMLAASDESLAPDTKAFVLTARHFLRTYSSGRGRARSIGAEDRLQIEHSLRARIQAHQ